MRSMRNILTLVAVLFLSACATVPFDYPREATQAISPETQSTLKTQVDEWRASNPGPSGFYPLIDGNSALAARIKLIERAEHSIDAQYFLMKGDAAGHIFAGALLNAAERGVRIRFLLDDIFTTVEDKGLDILDAHPNIEVRLFNPVARGGVETMNFLRDFKRANRRMHNKSFTVDNQVSIVGGRNIADEYFELRPEGEFLDLDVLAVGPVAADVSRVFDSFWNHERSLPLEAVSSTYTAEELEELRLKIIHEFATRGESIYEGLDTSTVVYDFLKGTRPLVSASGRVVTDSPDKLINKVDKDQQVLARELREVVEAAETEVVVLTPYLVPMDRGVEFFRSIAAKGVRVQIVTNSLASNNHTSVHSGYAGYRKPLLKAGVELYEVRANAVSTPSEGEAPEMVTLHTKAIAIDRKHIFVGSLNLDPRSIDINTEMGLLIESPELASLMAERVNQRLPTLTYRVQQNEHGKLEWRTHIDGKEVVETSEPLTSRWRRFQAFLLKIAPDSQL